MIATAGQTSAIGCCTAGRSRLGGRVGRRIQRRCSLPSPVISASSATWQVTANLVGSWVANCLLGRSARQQQSKVRRTVLIVRSDDEVPLSGERGMEGSEDVRRTSRIQIERTAALPTVDRADSNS